MEKVLAFFSIVNGLLCILMAYLYQRKCREFDEYRKDWKE